MQIFPSNKKEFIAVFAQDDFSQLYSNSDKYIDAFVSLAKYYPSVIINKSIDIGKDLSSDADAISYLQQAIVQLGNQHILIFLRKLKTLNSYQLKNLITFLDDVENHNAYPEYQRLTESLKKIGETKLANQFAEAKLLRIKQKNH